MRTRRAVPAFLLLLLAGCGLLGSRSSGPIPLTPAGAVGPFAGKRFVVLVYESAGKADGTGAREMQFRFQQSALLDQAVVEQKYAVSDRGTIQTFLETTKLPESGSFKTEDLQKIAAGSKADILLLGYYISTTKEGLISSKQESKAILRAINLQAFEIVGSVQGQASSDSSWKQLVSSLLRRR